VTGSDMLGDFLAARRRGVRRSDLGLPPIAGKLWGLRREEVAYLAGVSITWYTWLEQGRLVRPSRQVLNALAQTLRLSDAEYAYALALAGYSAPRPVAEPIHGAIPAQVQRFLDSMVEFPAYVIAPDWTYLAWNAAYAELYPHLPSVDEADRNLLWLLFTDPYLRELLPDWELTARSNVAAFRTAAGPGLSDPPFRDLVERLLEASELFGKVWESHPVEVLSSRLRVFRHPVAGELHFEQHNLKPSDHPDLHVVIYTPLLDTDTSSGAHGWHP
jgi:transcriptional regulator with XRE-family HTH domain